jgi:hypothetical protein
MSEQTAVQELAQDEAGHEPQKTDNSPRDEDGPQDDVPQDPNVDLTSDEGVEDVDFEQMPVDESDESARGAKGPVEA